MGQGCVTRKYMVSGRVQGVGFRYFVHEAATRLGVVGWVKNLPDGRVEVFAQADAARLDQLERSLLRGPKTAVIASVDHEDISDEVTSLKIFTVR